MQPPISMPPIPTAAAPDWIGWVIGSLIFVIVTLSGVIIYLFKLYLQRSRVNEKINREREDRHGEERAKWLEEKAAWDAEREAEHATLALSYETRAKELAQEYIRQGAHDREQALAREEQIRVYNAELHEKIAEKNEMSRTMMVELLQKIQMRITGRPRKGM